VTTNSTQEFSTHCALCGATTAPDGAVCCEDGSLTAEEYTLAIKGQGDPEWRTRIDAERCTAQFSVKSNRKLDAGRAEMADSPLFGGPRQGGLYE
jgi:hypothetical protein